MCFPPEVQFLMSDRFSTSFLFLICSLLDWNKGVKFLDFLKISTPFAVPYKGFLIKQNKCSRFAIVTQILKARTRAMLLRIWRRATKRSIRGCLIVFAKVTVTSNNIDFLSVVVSHKVNLQSGPETALLVANPTWASKIWPCVHAKSDRFLSILD